MLDQDALIPLILEPNGLSKESGRNWAGLIQKIYEVDALICPKCSGAMKVISVIKDEKVIKNLPKKNAKLIVVPIEISTSRSLLIFTPIMK